MFTLVYVCDETSYWGPLSFQYSICKRNTRMPQLKNGSRFMPWFLLGNWFEECLDTQIRRG